MGGIDCLLGAVLAGFLVRGLCRGLLVESLAFFGLPARAWLQGWRRTRTDLAAGALAGALKGALPRFLAPAPRVRPA